MQEKSRILLSKWPMLRRWTCFRKTADYVARLEPRIGGPLPLSRDGVSGVIGMLQRIHMTPGDVVLLAGVVAAAALLFFLMPHWVLSGGDAIEIIVDGKMVGRYSLHEDRTIEVPGDLGKTTVRIKQGRAGITDSPCPHKICVRMGTVGREGGMVVCVPNKVVVKVGKGAPEGLDAVSR